MTADFNVILNFNSAKPVITGAEFKAGDKGFTINMDVRELDPTGMTPKIAFYRSNGTSVESAAVTNVGNIFSYTLLGNELAVPGIVVADLKFYDGDDQRISSASFIFTAIADTLDGLGGGTESYSDELEQLSAEFQDTLDDYIDAFGNTAPINPRGDYDNAATYEPRDMVYDTNTGTSWVCKQESTDNAPGSPSAYWQKLVNSSGSANLGDLADVDTTGAASGDLLGFDGADWEPVDFPDADDIDYDNTSSGLTATKVRAAIDEVKGLIPTIPTIPEKTSDLSDVASTAPTNGQILKFNSTSGKYEPANESGGGGGGTQHNLLINPFFTVNQRGFTSSNSSNEYYTADRWKKNGSGTGTLTLSNGIFTIDNTNGTQGLSTFLRQYIETDYAGQTVTLSAMLSDGTIKSGSATVPARTSSSQTVITIDLDNGGNSTLRLSQRATSETAPCLVQINVGYGHSCAVKAIKLEIGSTSTLHLDTAPDYSTELLKCQRYFVRLGKDQVIMGFGVADSATRSQLIVKLPVPTRDYGTVSYAGNWGYQEAGLTKIISAITRYNLGSLDVVDLLLTSSGLTAGVAGLFYATTAGSYLDIDAEL